MTAKAIFDLKRLSEDDRVAIIGQQAASGLIVAFIVDDDGLAADRYVTKLRERFNVREVERFQGPVKGAVTVKVGPAES